MRRPPDVEVETLTITDPLTVQVADLFNAIYETTLQTLSRYFVHSGETDGQVTTLATTAKHLMNWVMRPLGSLLTTLPVGPGRPGVLTGRPSRLSSRPSTCSPTARRPGGSWPNASSSWPTGPTG